MRAMGAGPIQTKTDRNTVAVRVVGAVVVVVVVTPAATPHPAIHVLLLATAARLLV